MKVYYNSTITVLLCMIILFAIAIPSSSQNRYILIGDPAANPKGVLKCRDGGYLTFGNTYLSGYPNSTASICKLDSAMNILWHRYFTDGQSWMNVKEASSGGFFLVSSNISHRNEISKTDSAGNILWRKEYPTHANLVNLPLSVEIDHDDNLFIIYESNYANKGMLSKVDSSGNILWQKDFCTDLNAVDNLYKAKIGTDNSVYIMGAKGQWSPGDFFTLTKMDLDANFSWVLYYDTRYTDFTCLPHSELLISGDPDVYPPLDHVPLNIVRLDSSGNTLSSIFLYNHDYVLTESSMISVNDSVIQILGTAQDPTNLSLIYPFKLTMDTSGHIMNSVLYNDTSLHKLGIITYGSESPDLSYLLGCANGNCYEALIYDPDTGGICFSVPFDVDTIVIDYPFSVSRAICTFGPTNFSVNNLTGTSILGNNYFQDGCTVNKIVNAESEQRPQVFPLPFNDKIAFFYPGDELYRMELFDFSGRLVSSREFRTNLFLNTENFSSGIYFYTLRSAEKQFTGKIIK